MIKRHFKTGHDMASGKYCHQKAAVQWTLLQRRKGTHWKWWSNK